MCLGAATYVHHHRRDLSVYNLFFAVKIEHVDGRHFGRSATGSGGTPRVCLVYQVGVRVLLQVHVLALPRAVVGLVALRRNNPVPAEILEVHGKGVTAAAGLGGMFVTVQPTVPLGPFGCLGYFHLHKGFLR